MTGGRYQRIPSSFWHEPAVRSWSDDARLLAMFLLTCDARTTEGLFRLPIAAMAYELGWAHPRVCAALDEMEAAGFVELDVEVDLVFLPWVLRWTPPAGPKQITGAVRALAGIVRSPLRVRLLEHARQFCPKLAEAIDERLDWTEPEPTPPGPGREGDDEDLVEAEAQDDAAGGAADAEVEQLAELEHQAEAQAVDNPAGIPYRYCIEGVSPSYSTQSHAQAPPVASPRARPPSDGGTDLEQPGGAAGDRATAVVVAALARMRIAGPSAPTTAEMAAVAAALARGWRTDQLLNHATRAGQRLDVDHPRRWTLGAWSRLATSDPPWLAEGTPIPPAAPSPLYERHHPPDCPFACSREGWIDGPDGMQRCPWPGPAAATGSGP